MHGCAPDLDGDDRVEASNGGLEWLQGGILVWKDTKLGDRVVNIGNAKGDAGGDVFVRAEPGIALSLAEEPVEEGVVPVVVHVGGQARPPVFKKRDKTSLPKAREQSPWGPAKSTDKLTPALKRP